MAIRGNRNTGGSVDSHIRYHMLAGWTGLCVFLTLGIALEIFHALKLSYYLDVRNETRQFMWRLAHAHGTLLSLVNIAFALSLRLLRDPPLGPLQWASACLIGSLILLPIGFFLGGLWLYGGDPGIGVFVVPVGAVMLLGAVGIFLVILYRSPLTPAKEPRDAGPESRRRK